MIASCISFDSYIKPQLMPKNGFYQGVVYLLIPTSNHNTHLILIHLMLLYIFWFLHQTTTLSCWVPLLCCCISFDSYIKPQLVECVTKTILVVYLLIPTSNHNLLPLGCTLHIVVYLLIPTSNHNRFARMSLPRYVVYLLIPTSNHNIYRLCLYLSQLYIFWFLHQTTT